MNYDVHLILIKCTELIFIISLKILTHGNQPGCWMEWAMTLDMGTDQLVKLGPH